MRSKQNSGRPMGFTLIEVLVVVAIIAMLVAILLPSLQRARAQARSATDLSNQHQIGLAINGRAVENKDTVPRGGSWEKDVVNWVQVVARYMGDKRSYPFVNDMPIDKMEIFHCTERKVSLPHPFLDYSVNALDPKGMPGGARNDEWDEQRESKITEFLFPSKVIYIACAEREDVAGVGVGQSLKICRENWQMGRCATSEFPEKGNIPGIDAVDVWQGGHLPETPTANPTTGDVSIAPNPRRVARAMHFKRFTNALFWDGHAEGLQMALPASLSDHSKYRYWLRLYGAEPKLVDPTKVSDAQLMTTFPDSYN